MSDAAFLKQRLMEFQSNLKSDKKFSNKRNKKLQNLLNEPVHVKTNIRVKLPNHFILDITLALREKIEELFKIIYSFLENKTEGCLFKPPFVSKRVDAKLHMCTENDMFDMDWVPCVTLAFKYYDEELNLKKVLIIDQEKYL